MVRIAIFLVLLLSGPARAELNSLFMQGQQRDDTQVDGTTQAGLFAPSGDQGLFAPLPERPSPQSQISTRARAPMAVTPFIGTGNTAVDQLLGLIARAEAGAAGYDAVQHGARIRPSKRPTQMTLGEIYRWIEATPGQPHAIGRYQFIPDTLRRVASIRGWKMRGFRRSRPADWGANNSCLTSHGYGQVCLCRTENPIMTVMRATARR